MPSGCTAVSPCRTSISSKPAPRRSATICENVVTCPWPCGDVPISACTLPVGSTRIVAASQPPAPYLRAPLRLVAPHALVVEHRERLVERGVVVAGVDRQAGCDRRGELVDEVQPADLDRVLPHLARERVDRTLDRIRRLGPAGAAIGVCRRRVREHTGALEAVRDRLIRPC